MSSVAGAEQRADSLSNRAKAMIFAETREGRRFVGEVPPGVPLMATLRQLVDSYRIDSGWIEATGLVRDAIVLCVGDDGRYSLPKQLPGYGALGSCKIVVSHKNGARDLVATAVLQGQDGSVLAGQIQEAVSASVELTAQTFDDITLRRFEDLDTGHWRWMDVAVNVVAGDAKAARSGRLAMEALPSRLLEPEEMPQLKVGDALQHPALGLCVVTQVHDQDRVAIQMESGKVAQLHLGVLTLSRAGQKQGRTVYEVQVRRRAT